MLSSSRVLAGSGRFSLAAKAAAPARASGVLGATMKRKDSFMVEVNVGETESEDQAVRRYMRAVVQSGVLNKLRARRTKETKIETYKRKLAERAQARKLGIEEPTWEEFYGENVEESKPFDEFFCKPGDAEEEMMMGEVAGDMPLLDPSYYSGPMYDLSGYTTDGRQPAAGGYMDQGGYINQQSPAGDQAAAAGQQPTGGQW